MLLPALQSINDVFPAASVKNPHTPHAFDKKALYLKIKTNHTIDFNKPPSSAPHLEEEAMMARGQTGNSGRVSGYYSPSPTAAAALIHPLTVAMGRHENPLTSLLLLPSHHSEAHPFDCHRSSFLFCFHPSCVPIQSIFISLLGSFNSCFHCRPDRSIFP